MIRAEVREVITMKDTKLGVDGAALAPEEVQQLKGVIRRTKREEQSYWNRSIRISNLDQIPKEGSRYSNIKNILRKKGLEFLIIQCESYFLYNDKAASSSLRITFRSYQERNYYMIRARKQLRDLENKSIWLDNMVSPEFVAKKKELIHLGQTLKTEGEIVKFSVEMRQGFPQLKVITKESKVSWVDETSCDPNLSVGACSKEVNFNNFLIISVWVICKVGLTWTDYHGFDILEFSNKRKVKVIINGFLLVEPANTQF